MLTPTPTSKVQCDSTNVPLGLGQGKRSVTILTEAGCFYPIISHYSYEDRQLRARSAPQNAGRIRGVRPMHRTTFMMAKPPWRADQTFRTTHKQTYSGSKSLNPVRRPPLCPSMHTSQIKLQQAGDEVPHWNTHYTETFIQKPIVPANRLHLTSLVNRIDQQEGADMKESIKMGNGPNNQLTQYTRIHSKLGNLLGTGVSRDYPVRQEYNVITGETGGPAWRDDNKRISGNRVLHGLRKEQTSILG